ncbi:PRC-barrel domain-containing protein [Bradyrhizobium pachyrhizi]|uniref:PRC-barrel domain-containing protein n=1 Tax=Bradyrhizobium pachyrhizi TaxID=280333 RepID=UPI0012F81630|nr:PRC-barrel domain-containing protein [Bradyrhizobium pachyrhizi]
MKHIYVALVAATAIASPGIATAQTAGGEVLGVSASVLASVVKGWSAKKSVLGKEVHNDASPSEKVGMIEDIIVTPDDAVSYLIIDVKEYLGLSNYNVAIPIKQIKWDNNKFVLPKATKDSLRALPPFEYAK